MREKEKMLVTSIFAFSHNVFNHLHNKFQLSVIFISSSRNAFTLDKPRILLFGKELTFSQTTSFRFFQIQRVCRQQFQSWWKWHKVLLKSRKHCGKRRNCLLRAISAFLTVFSKDLYCRHVETRAYLGKGCVVTSSFNSVVYQSLQIWLV